jgi:hypothetical protein
MRSKSLAKLLVVLVGLLMVLAPAAKAAENLVLTCTICTELVVTGKGLPANDEVRVSVVAVEAGKGTKRQF